VAARARRRDKLQPWLAAWFAALLVFTPFARPCLPIELAAPVAPQEARVAHDDARGEPPAAELRPAQRLALGILSRLLLVETTLGLPAGNSPVLRPADPPMLANAGAAALDTEPRSLFQRSAVGSARTPTGPPA
jgi:hypothetical protein